MHNFQLNLFPWRRHHNDVPGFSRVTGFTTVELMMSLVLLAIGAALSLPSYWQMIEKRRLTHGAEQIMAFVNSAQGEAAKRNRVVTVSYDRVDDDDWCVGMVLGQDECDCMETNPSESDYCAIDSQPRIINNHNTGDTDLVKEMNGAGGQFSIDPVRGIFSNLDESLVVEMRSDSGDYRLDLRVNKTGQAILCSHDSSHSVPGYDVCP